MDGSPNISIYAHRLLLPSVFRCRGSTSSGLAHLKGLALALEEVLSADLINICIDRVGHHMR